VTIEGAGKDHASAGGSYDVAMQLITDVFHAKQPMKLAYEFFLSGGKKMSSSKGLGLTGEALLEVLPPQIVRFLMIKAAPNQAVEFSPYTSLMIPQLYDVLKAAGSIKII
jgi:lysyl-tRNA synthetase class 1